jgi:aspartyl protease family protein
MWQPPEALRVVPLLSRFARKGGRRQRGGAALARRPLAWAAPVFTNIGCVCRAVEFIQIRSTFALAFFIAVLCFAPSWAHAQSVGIAGMLGSKALLVVDAHPPRALAAGDEFQGVKVLSVDKDEATVEVQGKRQLLRLGEAPVSVGGRGGSGRRVVLMADSRGHFVNSGTINGRVMQYMVDTGASTVAIGRNDADRMGLNYQKGQPVRMSTANGVAQGWRMKLDSVRIGDVEVFGVEAIITPQPMPYVLLGNSFLTEFQMTRINDQMVLEKRN